MESAVEFFATLPSYGRGMLLVAGLVFFWIVEGTVPLFPVHGHRLRHARLNLVLTFLQLLVAVAAGSVVVGLTGFVVTHHWGLLQWAAMPPLNLSPVGQVVMGLLLLDLFGGYLIHRLEHSLSWMWRFHIVHHADTAVDVTSGLRHHPVETLFRLSSQLLAIGLGGIPFGVVIMYQVISVFFAQLTHANIRFPGRLDHMLSWLLVTPSMHKVHHHHEKPWTDTNYGNVFSIWDRLFGTFVEISAERLHYGIDSVASPDDHNRLWGLLTLPFRLGFRRSNADHE